MSSSNEKLDSIINNEIKIREKINDAFLEIVEDERVAYDIGFHMTDWLSDLQEIVELYSNIDNVTSEEIELFMYRFLAHVPNHLNAAKKLSGMGKVEDIFKASIFEEDE